MYNSVSAHEVPSFLPISVSVVLETWFSSSAISKGLDVIRAGGLSKLFIFRDGAACLVDEKDRIHVLYEETSRISLGFTIKAQHCELCGYNSKTGKEGRCEHLAALCILSVLQTDDSSYFPAPLLFKGSTWGKLAEFLYDWLSGERGDIEKIVESDKIKFYKIAQGGKVESSIRLDTVPAPVVFENQRNEETAGEAISRLWYEVKNENQSSAEKQLMEAGAESKGWKRDISIWSQLCTQCFLAEQNSSPLISYDQDNNFFTVASEGSAVSCCLKLVLPRHRTVEVLQKLGEIPHAISLLPQGRQGNQVGVDGSGNIRVNRIVQLDDGRSFLLSELEKFKYGNHYYFHGEGFFKLGQIDPEAKIENDNRDNFATPLFAVAEAQNGFVVDKKEIAEFLEKYKGAFEHPDNLVEPQVMEMRVEELPDGLVIERFSEDKGWFYVSLLFDLGGILVPLSEILSQLKEGENITIGHTTLVLKQGPLGWFYQMAAKSRWTFEDGEVGVKLTRGEFAALTTSVSGIKTIGLDGKKGEALQNLNDPQNWSELNSAIRFPEHLRDYQKNGLSWLHTIYRLGLGGILADDMGLGKTHQALSLLEMAVNERQGDGPLLVVCPASVLLHWAEKIDQFYPKLKYLLYYGQDRRLVPEFEEKIVITTYGIVRSDIELLSRIYYEVIILDEIQTLKNRDTVIHQAVSSMHARVKVGLSGTPIENSLSDLFSIFNICLPGFFGPFERFKKRYLVGETKSDNSRQLESLRQRVHPFILRRSRAQVLVELPDVITDMRMCELSEMQLELYNQTLSRNKPLLYDLADQDKRIDYIHVFKMITRLKQICNHPCLIEGCTDPDAYKSGKWDLFVDLLHECLESNRKVVVFSQYLGMLDLMKSYLASMKVGSAELRGNMSIAKRKAMIDTFAKSEDCKVFCASLMAGGTGIDLIAGTVVIHYDRWWNAAKEEQATARVHRLGQRDTVQLFHLITRGSMEEKINTIISQKKHLSDTVVKEDEAGIVKQFTRTQLLDILGNITAQGRQ